MAIGYSHFSLTLVGEVMGQKRYVACTAAKELRLGSVQIYNYINFSKKLFTHSYVIVSVILFMTYVYQYYTSVSHP